MGKELLNSDKELLLKDLCGRLPYGVKCEVYDRIGVLDEISSYGASVDYSNGEDTTCRIEYVKPYLFPLSSMTEKQKKYITDRWGINEDFDFEIDPNWGNFSIELGEVVGFINWCYENHFDINSLIPRELANDATGLNIY